MQSNNNPAQDNYPQVDMQGNIVPSRVYGPIQQQGPQAQQSSDAGPQTNALVAQLLAALGVAQGATQAQGAAAATQQPTPTSPEDARLLTALAGIHVSGRDPAIIKRTTIGGGLYFVKYSFSPATGLPETAHALVYDDGASAHVFGGQ
jgi:hypothetical protein